MLRKTLADNTSADSAATRLRRRRFEILIRMLDAFNGPVSVLDVGGRPQYWESMLAGRQIDKRIQITLLNTVEYRVARTDMMSVVGDARAMPQFADGQFDIAFSNSVIEHVGTREDQAQMATEMRRVGKAYYVQTPNRHFPIEPHFLFPFFQYLPVSLRAWLANHFALGWYDRIDDRHKARDEVRKILLMSRKDVRQLFPDAYIHEERYLGLVKSFVAFRPFTPK